MHLDPTVNLLALILAAVSAIGAAMKFGGLLSRLEQQCREMRGLTEELHKHVVDDWTKWDKLQADVVEMKANLGFLLRRLAPRE